MNVNDIVPINNQVLLKPVNNKLERALPSGIIVGVPSHTQAQYLANYAQRHFHVIKTPKHFVNPSTKKNFFYHNCQVTWGTEMELKEGDMVWALYRQALNAPRFEIDGEEYLFMNYTHLFVAQRKADVLDLRKPKPTLEKDEQIWQVIPLNGYIIGETMKDEKKSKLDVLGDRRNKQGQLKVKYIGRPNDYYVTLGPKGKFIKTEGDKSPIKPGNVIYTEMPDNKTTPGQFYIPIEGEYFHDFNEETRLYAIDRRFITAYA